MDGQQQQPATNAPKKSMGPMLGIIGIIVIVVVGIVIAQGLNKPQTQNATTITEQAGDAMQPQNTGQEAAQPTTGEAMTASAYKDGTYTAVGNYTSPGGAETLGVTLTIANGVVTDSQVEVQATRPMSKTRQTDFAEHYKTEVVGKNIDELNLGKVSGSSLSPKGFNDAVEKIKAEAKA